MNRRTALLLLFPLFLACQGSQPGSHNLIIATATPGGTYYPVGVALGSIITRTQSGEISASAITSAGSAENIQMLVNKEVQLAILQSLYGAMAYRGKGTYAGQPVKQLRSITVLWENVEHFLLDSRYAKTGTIQDIQNLKERFSIGQRNSGTEGSTLTILQALGIEPEIDFTAEYLGYNPSVQALIDGRIAGASTPAGPPAASVTLAMAQLGETVTLLSFTREDLQKIRAEFPVWTAYTLPPLSYPGQSEPIETIAQPNFLACHEDLPEDLVYTLTQTIYDHLPEIQNIHKATSTLKLADALVGLAVPLHPGARKYYLEKGIEIPADLSTP